MNRAWWETGPWHNGWRLSKAPQPPVPQLTERDGPEPKVLLYQADGTPLVAKERERVVGFQGVVKP